jgi:hypothetical protein
MSLVYDIAGWIGALALLGAYALVSRGRVTGDGPAFQALNLLGAIGLLINGVHHQAWPSAALNAVWLLIGAAAFGELRRGPRASTTRDSGPTTTGQTTDRNASDARSAHSSHPQEHS